MSSAVANGWNSDFLERWQGCLSNEVEIDSITDLKSSLASEIASKLKQAKGPADLDQLKDLLNRAIQLPSQNGSKICEIFIQATKYLLEGATFVIDGYFYEGDMGIGTLQDRIKSINAQITNQNNEKAQEEFVQLVGMVFQKKIVLSSLFIYQLPKGLEPKVQQWLSALNLIWQQT